MSYAYNVYSLLFAIILFCYIFIFGFDLRPKIRQQDNNTNSESVICLFNYFWSILLTIFALCDNQYSFLIIIMLYSYIRTHRCLKFVIMLSNGEHQKAHRERKRTTNYIAVPKYIISMIQCFSMHRRKYYLFYF